MADFRVLQTGGIVFVGGEMTDKQRIEAYFAAFNGGDTAAMLEMVDEQVAHHVNQGGVRQGKALFEEFNTHMTRCYRETLEDIVVFEAAVPGRVAAEFIVSGEYLATDEGLPEASGQRYRLPAASFFELRDGRITRITTYYNLPEWIRQVGG